VGHRVRLKCGFGQCEHQCWHGFTLKAFMRIINGFQRSWSVINCRGQYFSRLPESPGCRSHTGNQSWHTSNRIPSSTDRPLLSSRPLGSATPVFKFTTRRRLPGSGPALPYVDTLGPGPDPGRREASLPRKQHGPVARAVAGPLCAPEDHTRTLFFSLRF
jgi:hypothetical protein